MGAGNRYCSFASPVGYGEEERADISELFRKTNS